MFGKATLRLAIEKFYKIKRIDFLQAFPLKYYWKLSEIRAQLIRYGQIFNDLRGVHHRQYQGTAFYKDNNSNKIKIFVKSQIIINMVYSQQINPNYTRPKIDKLLEILDLSAIFNFTKGSIEKKDQIKKTDLDLTKIKD